MKIILKKQSEVFLTHKLANALERNTNLIAYVSYYWKGDKSLRNARFDLVLYDEELNIKAVFLIIHKKSWKFRVIKFNGVVSNIFLNNRIERYHNVLSKENIPLFLVNLNENNEKEVLGDILNEIEVC